MDAPPEENEKRVCLLIVDDDADMIFLVERMIYKHLSPDGLPKILTARSPDEALGWLAQLEKRRLMVLSDYNLRAEKTGAELLGEIARLRPDSARVLMSGSTKRELPSFNADHVHDFIPKDEPPAVFAARLAQWLARVPETRPSG